MKKCNILVVEDEALIAANLVHTLSSLGYTVQKPVATGEEAILAVKARKPDLVLMDIQLIGAMNGIEAAEKIRVIADIPIIYLTAYTEDLRLKQAKLTEPYGYIVKPAHSRELNATIEMALYKHGLDRKLRVSEERNRSIVEALPGFIFQFSADGRFIDCQFNKGDLLLLPPDQIIGRQVAEILPPDLAHLTEMKIRETLDSGQLQSYEYSLILQDQERFFEARMITCGINSVLAFVYDITERKVAEEALNESELLFREVFNNANDSVFLLERTPNGPGKYLLVNDKAVRMLGYSKEELLEMSPRDIVPEDIAKKTMPAVIKKLLKDGHATFESVHKKKDGSTYQVEVSTHTFHYKGKEVDLSIVRDITERKMVEDALKESEEKYRALFSAESDGIFVVDKDSGTIINCNDAVTKMYGYRKDEVIGQLNTVMSAEPDETRAATKEVKDSIPIRFHKRKDGTVFPVEITANVVSVQGRNVIIAAVRDITERKRAEEALSKSEQKYRNIFEKSVTGLFKTTPDGSLIEVNDAFARIYDYSSAAEILADSKNARNNYISRHLYANPEDRKEIHHILSEKGEIKNYETLNIKRDGTHVWVSITARVIKDTDNNVLLFEGTIIDITKRKVAEEALKDSEEFNRNLVENLPDYIVVYGSDGKILYVNPASAKALGYDADKLAGTPLLLYVVEDQRDEVISRISERRKGGEVPPYEIELLTRDGHRRSVIVKGTPIKYQNNPAYLLLFVDITERKLAEETLFQANKKLTLLSSITRHDISNQLTILMGYLTIMEKKQTDPTFNNYFRKVNTSAKRISSMIQFTKEYENIGINTPVWQDCRTLVDTVTKEALPVKIIVKNDLPAGQEVFADPLVVKVFYNLMDNAGRYGGKITTIRFFVEECNGDHRIVCEDDGDGVVTEEKEKIFERGFGKNTGLGLALAREILDITGITITETGEPGTGARFEMIVPKGAWR